MNAGVFDWNSIASGEVHTDGADYRWQQGSVHAVFATGSAELLIFIDRVMITLLYPNDAYNLVALLRGKIETASIAEDLELREAATGGLSIGGDLDSVVVTLTTEEVLSVAEGVMALLPYLKTSERSLGID